jgi:hypothetical protein
VRKSTLACPSAFLLDSTSLSQKIPQSLISLDLQYFLSHPLIRPGWLLSGFLSSSFVVVLISLSLIPSIYHPVVVLSSMLILDHIFHVLLLLHNLLFIIFLAVLSLDVVVLIVLPMVPRFSICPPSLL